MIGCANGTGVAICDEDRRIWGELGMCGNVRMWRNEMQRTDAAG